MSIQKNRPGDSKKVRRPYFLLALAAAALVLIGVSSFVDAGASRPLRYYTDSGNTALTYFTNGSGENVSYWGINTDNPLCELDINGTICVNRTGFYYNGVNLTPSADGNNYPTSLAVNQTNGNYTIQLGRNGLSTLQASFSVNSTGAGGSGNVTASGGVAGWPTKFNTATDLTILNLSCAPGGALSTLSNDSICTNFVQSEVDPVWSAASTNYYTKTELDVNNASVWAEINSKGTGNGNATANNSVNNIPVHTGGGNLTQTNINYSNGQTFIGSSQSGNSLLNLVDPTSGTYMFTIVRPGVGNYSIKNTGGTPNCFTFEYATSSGVAAPFSFLCTSSANNYSAGDYAFSQVQSSQSPTLIVKRTADQVGIGTPNTHAKLTVAGNATITGPVGIGTTNPNNTLEINGNVTITNNANSQSGVLQVYNTFGGSATALRVIRPTVGGVIIRTVGGTPADGSIGVETSSNTQITMIRLPTGSSGGGLFAGGDFVLTNTTSLDNNLGLKFQYNNSRIGIGTALPNSTLHVVGTGNFTNYLQADNVSSRVVCVGGDCRTSWPSGTFTYSNYFNQNLNTTSNVTFNNITASTITIGGISKDIWPVRTYKFDRYLDETKQAATGTTEQRFDTFNITFPANYLNENKTYDLHLIMVLTTSATSPTIVNAWNMTMANGTARQIFASNGASYGNSITSRTVDLAYTMSFNNTGTNTCVYMNWYGGLPNAANNHALNTLPGTNAGCVANVDTTQNLTLQFITKYAATTAGNSMTLRSARVVEWNPS